MNFIIFAAHNNSTPMITKLINATGAAFEAFFTILPSIGPLMNILIIFTGTVATVGWIWYMNKRKEEK